MPVDRCYMYSFYFYFIAVATLFVQPRKLRDVRVLENVSWRNRYTETRIAKNQKTSEKLQKRKHRNRNQNSGNSQRLTPISKNNSVDLNSTESKFSKRKKHCNKTKNKNCSSSTNASETFSSKEQWELLNKNNDKLNGKNLDRNRVKTHKNERTIIITTDTELSNPRKSSMITILQHEPILDKNRTIILTKKFQKQDTSIFETAHEDISSNAVIKIERKQKTKAENNSTNSFKKLKNKRDFSTTVNPLTLIAATTKSTIKNKTKRKKGKKISTTESAKGDFGVEVFSPIMIQSKYERQEGTNSKNESRKSTENENITPKVNVTQEFIKNESTSRNFSLLIEKNITNNINSKNTSNNSSATYKFIKDQIHSFNKNNLNSSLSVTEPSIKRSRKPGKHKKGGKGRTTTTETLKNFSTDSDVELLPSTKLPRKKLKHKKGNENSTGIHKIKKVSNDTVLNKHIILDYSKLNKNLTDIQIGNYTAKVGSAAHQYLEKYNDLFFSNTTDLVLLDTKKDHKNFENYETFTIPKIKNEEKLKRNGNKTSSTRKKSDKKSETLLFENNNNKSKIRNHTQEDTTFSKKQVKAQNVTTKHQHEFEMHVHQCHMKCVNYWRKLYEDLLKNVSSQSNGAFQGFTPIEDRIDSGLVDSSEGSLDCWKTISDSGVESSSQFPREEERNKGKEKNRENNEEKGKKKKTKKRKKKGKKRVRTTLRNTEESTTLGSVTNLGISDFVSVGKIINSTTLSNSVGTEIEISESFSKANTSEENENFQIKGGDILITAKLQNTTETTTWSWLESWNWLNPGSTKKEEKKNLKSLKSERTAKEDGFWNTSLKVEGPTSEAINILKISTESSTLYDDSKNSKTNSQSLNETNLQIKNVIKNTNKNKSINCESSDCKIDKSEDVEKISSTEKYSSSTKMNKKNKKIGQKCKKGSESDRCKKKRKTTKPDFELETTTKKFVTTSRFQNHGFLSDEDFDSKEIRNRNNEGKNVEIKTSSPKTTISDSFWSIFPRFDEDDSEIKSGDRSKKDDNVISRDKKREKKDEIVQNENDEQNRKDEKNGKDEQNGKNDEEDDIDDIDDKDEEYYDDLEKCRDYEHFCDGRCLAHKFICDAKQHCNDGSDEENCSNDYDFEVEIEIPPEFNRIFESTTYSSKSCGEWEYFCDGKCIIKAKLCDGIRDCNDGSDEDLEECKAGRPETKVPFAPNVPSKFAVQNWLLREKITKNVYYKKRFHT